MTLLGKGYTGRVLAEAEVRELATEALGQLDLAGKRVLVLIPDGTRTAPIPLFFRLFHELLWDRVAALDYLIALGTHHPLPEDGINRLVGVTAAERAGRYAGVDVYNHDWYEDGCFRQIGVISAGEMERISGGLWPEAVPVALNCRIFDYDQLIICGPTFPHEVAGFSGGNKYLFPGIAGLDVINCFHWMGAVITSTQIIGTRHNPVRDVIDRAAAMVDVPRLCFSLVVPPPSPTPPDSHTETGLAGLYVGSPEEAYEQAADLSARLHVVHVDRPFQRVLSVVPEMYDDLWTAAKGMYKLEPAVVDGGEVVIYAPHVREVSYTHGPILDRIGYHVRDYFLEQWPRFRDVPGGVLAHSTHLRGAGTYDPVTGVERPRIRVTLATGIPEERCRRLNLGYLDPATVDPAEWEGREDEGVVVVHRAGEVLYRVAHDSRGLLTEAGAGSVRRPSPIEAKRGAGV